MSTKKKKSDDVQDQAGEGSVFKEVLVRPALEILRDTKRPSSSTLQRRLKISFQKASRLMEHLEEHGVIGPTRGADPREILMDLDGELPEIPELPEFQPKQVRKEPLKDLKVLPPVGGEEVVSDITVAGPGLVEKSVEKSVDWELSQEEILAAGKDLADAQVQLAEIKAELADIKAEFKERIAAVEHRAREAGAKVRNGTESRMVKLLVTMDYKEESYRAVHVESGKVIEDRKMTPAELSDLPMGD